MYKSDHVAVTTVTLYTVLYNVVFAKHNWPWSIVLKHPIPHPAMRQSLMHVLN